MIGETHAAPCGQDYFVSPLHRGKPSEQKCIWTIGPPEEIQCFDTSYTKFWYVGNQGWGVLVIGLNSLDILGTNIANEDLRIAKFVHNAGHWHGYPADVNRKPQDRPVPEVLELWVNAHVISKPFRARIQGGRL